MGKFVALEVTARVVLVAFITGLVPIGVPEAAVAAGNSSGEEGTFGSETINPGFDPAMPPQFNLASVAGQGQLFQNCGGQLQAAVTQSMQSLGNLAQNMTNGNSAINGAAGAGMGPTGYGINAVCPGTDTGPSADSISCENITLPDGSLNQNALRGKASEIEMAMANISCKKGKFQALQGELGCLTAQADMLTQQLNSIEGAYQTNIQRMQKDVQKINQVISDRQSEDVDVLQRLNGGGGTSDAPGNGSKGLLGIRDGLCKALTGGDCGSGSGSAGGSGALGGAPDQTSIPGQIRTLQNQMTDTATKQQQLTEAINERTMGLAGDCFNNRPVPSFTCEKNGTKSVSAHEYILCMYKQKLGVGDSGQVDESAVTPGGIKANQNESSAASLATLLDQIMGDVPQKTPMPAAGGAPDASQIQAATLLSAADVESAYGTQLASFDNPKTPIHDFVMKNISACFQRAQKVVNQEKNMASSPIGQQQAALTKAQGDLKVNANQMLSGNVAKYEEAMQALTGMNMPLSTNKCNGAAPEVQVACLQDLQANMEALLHGNAKQTTVTMRLLGTDPKTNITFDCQGLNGCIAAYQNVDRNLKIEVKRVGAFKQQYVTAAKASVDNFTKQMAAMMNSQGAALNNKLKTLNSALASMGVGGGITIPPVKCEPTPPDQDGLPGIPPNSLKTIGCAMNPPMLDVSGNDFSTALQGVATGEKELADKMQPLSDAKNRLASKAAECGNKVTERRLTKLQTDTDQLASGNCQYSEQFCGSNNSGALAGLSEALGNIEGVGVGADSVANVTSTLEAGMSACRNPEAAATRWAIGGCQGTPPDGVLLGGYEENLAKGEKTDAYAKWCRERKPQGVAPASNICSSIATKLRRDVANVAGSSQGGGAAAGAR